MVGTESTVKGYLEKLAVTGIRLKLLSDEPIAPSERAIKAVHRIFHQDLEKVVTVDGVHVELTPCNMEHRLVAEYDELDAPRNRAPIKFGYYGNRFVFGSDPNITYIINERLETVQGLGRKYLEANSIQFNLDEKGRIIF